MYCDDNGLGEGINAQLIVSAYSTLVKTFMNKKSTFPYGVQLRMTNLSFCNNM